MTAKILVADDSITIQKIVAMAFENEDASVEGIGDGSEALTRLKKFQPDIVLADVDMPGLNGFELSREIKESSKLNSISVLLLASDFEEFDENLFHSSLANDHITKPFKSEDLVRKVRELLDGGSPRVANEETEEVIELSSTDRVDEDIVIDLGEGQRMDSLEGVFPKEEEVVLGLPPSLELTDLDDEDAEMDVFVPGVEDENVLTDPLPEVDIPVDVAATGDDQAKGEMTGQEESLDELLMRVEELSRKSEEISDNGSEEELSRMEAIDAMLKEVSALKDESCFVAAEEENNIRETADPQLSSGPSESEAVLAEVNCVSEENIEGLATAFDEISNGKKYPSPAIVTEQPDRQESVYQGGAVAAAPENLIGDFTTPSSSTAHETPLPNLKEESSPSKENVMVTGHNEDNGEKNVELSLLPEGQLNQLMEAEVRRILQQSLTPLIEQEISGLSEKIIQAVEENVRKITPGIAKEIIQKEIDKIKADG